MHVCCIEQRQTGSVTNGGFGRLSSYLHPVVSNCVFFCFVCLLDNRLRHQTAILSSTQVGLGAFASYPGCSGLSSDCGGPAQAVFLYPLPCVCPLTSIMPCRARVAPISLPMWLPPVLCRHGFSGRRAAPRELLVRMPQTRYRQIPPKTVKVRNCLEMLQKEVGVSGTAGFRQRPSE